MPHGAALCRAVARQLHLLPSARAAPRRAARTPARSTEMMRYFTALLLPAMFLVLTPAPADAQRPDPRLAGTYVNMNNGGDCYVEQRGSDYRFVNENGSEAYFRYGERGRLYLV